MSQWDRSRGRQQSIARGTRGDAGAFGKRSIEERFWEKVQPGRGCWLWQGSVGGSGHGLLWTGERLTGAHRVAYELLVGPIPEGLLVCHHCDVPLCVRPDHLFTGTPAQNMQDASRKGRLRRAA